MPWYNKARGAYARESNEAYQNALMAWGILSQRGWGLLAFCGFWGNVGSESGWNPWRWQNDNVLASTDYTGIHEQNFHAYGLAQWDPAAKYIDGATAYSGYGPNFSDRSGSRNEGTAQIMFLDDTAVSSGQYFINPLYSYHVSYEQYKAMTLDNYSYEYATRAWFHNYERGTWDPQRTISCKYFYEKLSGVTPPTPGGRIPIWLMFKLKRRNEGDIK